MKKQELYNIIERSIDHFIESDVYENLYNVAIETDKHENVIILGHFNKRTIDGVSVMVIDDEGIIPEEHVYDVTNQIIVRDSDDSELFKESKYLDRGDAIHSMYYTILSATENINTLLTDYTPEALMTPHNPTPFKNVTHARFTKYTLV